MFPFISRRGISQRFPVPGQDIGLVTCWSPGRSPGLRSFARILLVATPPEQVKPNMDSTWRCRLGEPAPVPQRAMNMWGPETRNSNFM